MVNLVVVVGSVVVDKSGDDVSGSLVENGFILVPSVVGNDGLMVCSVVSNDVSIVLGLDSEVVVNGSLVVVWSDGVEGSMVSISVVGEDDPNDVVLLVSKDGCAVKVETSSTVNGNFVVRASSVEISSKVVIAFIIAVESLVNNGSLVETGSKNMVVVETMVASVNNSAVETDLVDDLISVVASTALSVVNSGNKSSARVVDSGKTEMVVSENKINFGEHKRKTQ